jgi:GGDEF domain-containing protein
LPDSVYLPSWSDGDCGPFIGFSAAADGAVRQLSRQLPGMDLWLLTSVVGDGQHVVARSGRWADRAPVGAKFPWQASFCVRMISGQGSPVAPNFVAEPAYRQAAIGPLADVRAYLGVPVQIGEGELFGTLCALAGTRQPATLSEAMPIVTLLGKMLGTVLAGERAAHDRSADAANAYALAERDPVTRLRNRRGFEHALATEQGRGLRFGTRSSVLVATLDQPGDPTSALAVDRIRRCAEVLNGLGRPGDLAARIGGTDFAMLAVQTDGIGARALQARLRRSLRTAQLPARTATATCRSGEDLTETWERARQALRADQLRRSTLVVPLTEAPR